MKKERKFMHLNNRRWEVSNLRIKMVAVVYR